MTVHKELSYLKSYKSQFSAADYLPHVTTFAGKSYPEGVSLYDFLSHIALDNPPLFQLLDIYKNPPEDWSSIYQNLNKIDSGGFGHSGNVGARYATLQRDGFYSYSRLYAWQSFLEILKPREGYKNHHLIIDLLAGNGTSTRMLKKILPADQRPYCVGVDISEVMVNDTFQQGELVIRCSASDNLLKENRADAAICAYGTHHIPVEDRVKTVLSAKMLLNENGKFILHDFDEGTPTEKFYSEVIHQYRIGGHDYKHFNSQSIHALFKDVFPKHSVRYLYEPFYLVYPQDTSDEAIYKDFFIYLIRLLSLEKIIPEHYDYQHLQDIENSFWRDLKEKFEPYFTLSPEELAKCSNCINPPIPVVSKLSIIEGNNQKKLIAPRISLLGIGYNKNA